MIRQGGHIENDYPNRVAEAIYLYATQETQLKISNPLESRNEYQVNTLKLQYYSSIYAAFRKNANVEEKLSLRFVRHEMAKLKARLNPTTINKITYSRLANHIRNFVNGNNLFYRVHNKAIKNIEKELTHDHNFHNVSTEMKKAGFTFEMEATLRKMIAQDLPQFHFRYADLQNAGADFVLHFRKIPKTDIYYFEKFEAISRPSLDALLNNDPTCKRHTFPMRDAQKFTAKEAANLVSGNAVCKPVEGKETWLIIDLPRHGQQTSFRYIPFDLEKAIEKLPIKQLENPTQRKAILETLKTGSSKEVTFNLNNNQAKYTIQAAPLKRRIDITDRYNQPVEVGKLLELPRLTAKLVAKINESDTVVDLGLQKRRGRAI